MRKTPPDGHRFKPGQSGNPGGRPKLPDDIKKLARATTPEAFDRLLELMRKSKSDMVRLSAIQTVLDRAWGKAPQHVTLETSPLEHVAPETLEALAEALTAGAFGALDGDESSTRH